MKSFYKTYSIEGFFFNKEMCKNKLINQVIARNCVTNIVRKCWKTKET